MNARVLDRPCLDHGFRGNGRGYASARRPAPWAKPEHPKHKHPKVLLHRWVFFQEHGYLPEAVMHLCDNTRCIEPSHLAGGSQADNNRDRASKGRSAPWVPSRQRLTPEQVSEIRERFAQRTRRDPINGPSALAREFGVDANVIYQITDGRTYRNVA